MKRVETVFARRLRRLRLRIAGSTAVGAADAALALLTDTSDLVTATGAFSMEDAWREAECIAEDWQAVMAPEGEDVWRAMLRLAVEIDNERVKV